MALGREEMKSSDVQRGGWIRIEGVRRCEEEEEKVDRVRVGESIRDWRGGSANT